MSAASAVVAVCLMMAAKAYDLPPAIMMGIHAVEGGRPGVVSVNKNASEDYGVMQINSVWLPVLAEHYKRPEEEIRGRLIEDPCFNTAVAAWILRGRIDRAGGDVWRGVGHYHSYTPHLAERYRQKVRRALGQKPGDVG